MAVKEAQMGTYISLAFLIKDFSFEYRFNKDFFQGNLPSKINLLVTCMFFKSDIILKYISVIMI